MTILVIAEHDNAALKAATLNTVAAVSASLMSNPATELWRVISRAGCLTKIPNRH